MQDKWTTAMLLVIGISCILNSWSILNIKERLEALESRPSIVEWVTSRKEMKIK